MFPNVFLALFSVSPETEAPHLGVSSGGVEVEGGGVSRIPGGVSGGSGGAKGN